MLQGSGRCHYHPERLGLGVCVECRRVICVECTTQFEGINRCAKCLAKRLAAARTLADRDDWSVGSVLLGLFSLGSVVGTVYLVATLIVS